MPLFAVPHFNVPEGEALSCAVATAGGVVRVTVSGEIDLDTAPLLDDALGRAEDLAGAMILDLSGVEFIGCRGAQLLLATEHRVRACGDQVALDGASDVVTRLLYLLGVAEMFGLTAAPTPTARPDLHIVWSPTLAQ